MNPMTAQSFGKLYKNLLPSDLGSVFFLYLSSYGYCKQYPLEQWMMIKGNIYVYALKKALTLLFQKMFNSSIEICSEGATLSFPKAERC